MVMVQKWSKGGVSIQVYSGKLSGAKWREERDVGPATDVRHIVDVRNLMTHSANITCFGAIAARPHDVEYQYPEPRAKGPDDCDIAWTADTKIGDQGRKTFHHARLVPINRNGNANIHTDVTTKWLTLKGLVDAESATLSFDVNT